MKTAVVKLLLVISCLILLGGCFDKEQPTCAYWVPQLKEPVKGEQALDKMEELRCRDAVPVLAELYEEGLQRKRILRILTLIGDKEGGAPILKKAVVTRDLGKLASSIIEDWQLSSAKPELVEILTTDILEKNRPEALRALMSFSRPAEVQALLMDLASGDPNRQGLDTNLLAVRELGKLGSPDAVPALLKAAFIRTNTGGSIYMAARLALAKVGPKAAGPLVELIEGRNKGFQDFARKYGLQEWQWRYGPEIVQLLGDTLQSSVTPALAKNMTRELTPPMGISEAMQEKWRIAQMNRLRVAMLAIGHVGGNEGVEILSTLVGDPRADTRNQRLGAATALALIGSDVAQDALLTRYRDEPKTSMTKLLAEAFRQPMLQPLTLGLGHQKQADFDKLVKKPSDYVAEGLKAPQVVAYLGVNGACKGEASCLIKQLKGANKHAAVKAAVLLARSGGGMDDKDGDLYPTGDLAALRTTLVEHLESIPLRSVDAQRFTLIALTRIGDATTGDALLRIASEMENKSPAGKIWKTELEVFGNSLKHRQ